MLFQKREDDDTDSHYGKPVKLLRSIASVPRGFSITIRAELWGSASENFSFTSIIAEGTVEFLAELSDTVTKNIYGLFSEIVETVTWK